MNGRVVQGSASFVPPKTTHHSKKIARMGKFSRLVDTPELTSAREVWMAVLRPFTPSAPLVGAIRAHVALTWPWRKGDAMRIRKEGPIPCTVKPDCDNAAKTIFDIMALLGFFSNDAQIYSLLVTKWFGDKPGLQFRLEEE